MRNIFIILLGIVILVLGGLYFYPVAKIESKNPTDKEILISKSLSSIEITLLSRSFERVVFNEIDKDTVDYKMKGITFLSSKELINRASCDFYSIKTKKRDDEIYVDVYHNASGISYQFYYKKSILGGWIEIDSRWGYGKRALDRPKYICYEIRRLTKEWDMDKRYIPRDSIK